ncbi:protein kinase C-binding protein NELL1-like [Periophthalmus magnuspinnatus]|uniref:protein kinase C-binding protein NELL1-like n=1 Tax=Periophthalmus magnuspinnatus TaxID=409849 RepID=UPI0024364422|nr:protein kinase C-binding protein NELL1-like [Periophthalmus magnuspinnatus]
MDMYLFFVSLFAVLARPARGSDGDYQMDIIQELDRTNSTLGITQVPGLHNGSKAFLFRDVSRAVLLPPPLSSRLIQMFRGKSEFTFLATIQQKSSTSGVIFSIHESEHSFFELESSGVREEIRYRYRHRGEERSETFPYRLSDGHWHRIALSVSASHLQLHIDCNRVYERVIDPPQTDLPQSSAVWLGQHSTKHGLFKGVIQDVKFVFAPNGFIAQCPNLNRTCPTCSDFLSLVQGIMDLQDLLAKMTLKLTYAESRLAQLEDCHCERTCTVNGVSYRDTQGWAEPENCRTCVCKNGIVECRRIFCPPTNCSEDSLPVHEQGTCCRKCRPKCQSHGQTFAEGQRFLSRDCRECKNGQMVKVSLSCPELNCSLTEQVLPEGRCCNVCAGHDFCSEGVVCGLNSDCENLKTKAHCICRHGYASAHGDQTDCEDIDECSSQTHFCQTNSVCVNVPGSHRCDCLPGYTRVDQYSCTEHDDCSPGLHSCDANAICTNTVRGHLCTCKPGYRGNGTVCRAFCEEGCQSGGTCVAPNTCLCASGFTGPNCETDIDECSDTLVKCHNHSHCVNLPGSYHCDCRSGFHDDGTYQVDGSSCVDIDECSLLLHSCSNDSVCVNTPGGFSCLCTKAPDCRGDCPQPGGARLNGEEWTPSHDPCSICSCKEGEVECWPLPCPVLSCSYSALPQGECCPRCVSDPCTAQEVPPPALGLSCRDQSGSEHLSGDTWHLPNSPCTTCQCKNGSVCCAVELECLQNN